jgi:carboxyl-terminal processing protease
MLSSLDPHSWFLSREDNDRLNALERGELAVTGLTIELADGVPIVLDVTDDSPADHAGIRPGDRLLTVDGEPMVGLNARAIALRLAGDKGSRVRLVLERGPRLEPDSILATVKRENLKPAPSVSVARMLDSTTGYVRLREFGQKAADEVRAAIRRLQDRHAGRVILDLRGNPGGIVTEAVEMASSFLPQGTLVFSTTGRQKSVNREYRTASDGGFRDLPLVVLIDQNSASAAEAFTASMQDHDRAVVAGRRSFGKALMQTGFLIPDGFVELTIGHVLSPSGRYIQRRYTGLASKQYYAFAGDSSGQDTTRTWRTDDGRLVRGGGGVAPDVALPVPPGVPRWFSMAVDSGWDRAVADSVGFLLEAGDRGQSAWVAASATWEARLLPPLLDRVRSRLHIPADADSATRAAIARKLAARAATVRWGDDAGQALAVACDPDILAARDLFARAAEILHRP